MHKAGIRQRITTPHTDVNCVHACMHGPILPCTKHGPHAASLRGVVHVTLRRRILIWQHVPMACTCACKGSNPHAHMLLKGAVSAPTVYTVCGTALPGAGPLTEWECDAS